MKNGEQPAFANPGSDQGAGSMGLTKREYFAAMAMQAYISLNDQGDGIEAEPEPDSEYRKRISKISVQMADALLKQLES